MAISQGAFMAGQFVTVVFGFISDGFVLIKLFTLSYKFKTKNPTDVDAKFYSEPLNSKYFRFGRRYATLLCLTCRTFARVACALSPNFICFAVSRFFTSSFSIGLYACLFVMGKLSIVLHPSDRYVSSLFWLFQLWSSQTQSQDATLQRCHIISF